MADLKRWLRDHNLTDDWLAWAVLVLFIVGPLIGRAC